MSVVSCTQELYCSVKLMNVPVYCDVGRGGGDFVEP